jgi:hypothetical protein
MDAKPVETPAAQAGLPRHLPIPAFIGQNARHSPVTPAQWTRIAKAS